MPSDCRRLWVSAHLAWPSQEAANRWSSGPCQVRRSVRIRRWARTTLCLRKNGNKHRISRDAVLSWAVLQNWINVFDEAFIFFDNRHLLVVAVFVRVHADFCIRGTAPFGAVIHGSGGHCAHARRCCCPNPKAKSTKPRRANRSARHPTNSRRIGRRSPSGMWSPSRQCSRTRRRQRHRRRNQRPKCTCCPLPGSGPRSMSSFARLEQCRAG